MSEIMQVLMHEVLREDFERWLTARGLELQRTPFLDEHEDLPVYNVAPGQALWGTRPLPLHRTEAGYPNCSTCDGGGCLDCTDPA